MKLVFFFLFIIVAGAATGQTKKQHINRLNQEIEEAKFTIDSLTNLLNEERVVHERLLRLQKEIEELRKIMRGYIYEIDTLVTQNMQLRSQLDKANIPYEIEDLPSENGTVIEASPVPPITTEEEIIRLFGSAEDGQEAGSGHWEDERKLERVKRTVIQHVRLDDIQSNEDATLEFLVVVNEDGDVVDIRLNKGHSTTDNADLIHKVKFAILKQLKYNESKGSPVISMNYTVRVKKG